MFFEMASCGGCRTCEMACSFHHTEAFSPDRSSIKIFEKAGSQGFSVCLVEKGAPEGVACDGCSNLDVPLCVQYCKRSEDLLDILKEFNKNRSDL